MEEGKISPPLMEVSGTVIHFNKGAAFLQFQEEGAGGRLATCLFRPNRLLVEGRRLTTGQLRTVESIGQFLVVGDTLTGLLTPRSGARPYVLNADDKEPLTIEPAWYAEHIWKGEKPSFLCQEANKSSSEVLVSPKVDPEQLILDDVPGKIILNQLASGTGKAFSHVFLIKKDSIFNRLRTFSF